MAQDNRRKLMIWEILFGVGAAAAVPFTSWLTSVFLRKKHNTEIEVLRADINKKLSEVRSNELENVRTGNSILMEQVVNPLRVEIKSLRTDVNKFRRAIEKIPSCPVSADCPVRVELLADEKDAG